MNCDVTMKKAAWCANYRDLASVEQIRRLADLPEQMRRVKAVGVEGVALFAHEHITDGHLSAIAKI